MESLMNSINWNEILIWVIGVISAGVIFLIKNIAANFLNKTSNKLIKKAIEEAEKITLTTVNAIEESVIIVSKEKLADGKITKEEYKEILLKAKEAALNSLTKQIGDPLKKVMGSTIEEIKEFLSNLIEKKISEVKK